MSNVFTDTTGILANQGLHPKAKIVSTKHVGIVQTNEPETADIHVRYHRSFHPQASLVKFLAALGIHAQRGTTLDFASLVGKTLSVSVFHTTNTEHATAHADIVPLMPRKAGL